MSLLRADAVTLAYQRDHAVVSNLSLEVAAGEFVVIIGPNGAGKSSVLRAFVGGVRLLSGELSIDGRSSCTLGARERAREVAFLPQEIPPRVEMPVVEFVAGGRYAHRGLFAADREGPAAIEAALQRVCVEDLRDRGLGELSGGQRQRVLMARALAQESRALLVDEPTSSLDARHQVGIFALLRDFAREGKGVLAVTHDLNLASQFADRLCLMDRGLLRAEGTPSEVLVPSTLEEIYGPDLIVGQQFAPAAGEERPTVLAWRNDRKNSR